jgi:hypothetical protein
MEGAFSHNFGDVRVHSGTEADALARSVGAIAFTTGSDIFFRNGAYSEGSSGGKHVLAHELTHVVQQRGMSVSGPATVGAADDAYEMEAESTAETVSRDLKSSPASAGPTSLYARLLQRCGSTPCGCSPEERQRKEANMAVASPHDEDVDNDTDSGDQADTSGVAVDETMPDPEEAVADNTDESFAEESGGEEEVASVAVRAMPFETLQRLPAGHSFAALGITLQRWSVDGPADPNTNTIVCNGSGSIDVQTGATGSAEQSAVLTACIRTHEESHKADALASNATLCKDKGKNSQVIFSDGEQKPSEFKAYTAEINCLNAMLPTGDAKKDKIVKARIAQITPVRDGFK